MRTSRGDCRVQDDETAIRLANATQFGLSFSIWSASSHQALAIAEGVTTDAAVINVMTACDARVPFYGRRSPAKAAN
ncbi:aldehyde dehydrogenase family protein [Paraburkholderia caribensis]|uniref:aldehyde dehydrogenase family protein n=1 Tax=Paraburkholderia caribensis TaxID=75105 RepID=UPI0034D15505